MAIPVATTRISVERKRAQTAGQPVDRDPWEDGYPGDQPEEWETVASGVRAVVSVGTGRTVGPGAAQRVEFSLQCDPTDLRHLDRVRDETTGDLYEVEWAMTSPGVAGLLGSTRAGLSQREG